MAQRALIAAILLMLAVTLTGCITQPPTTPSAFPTTTASPTATPESSAPETRFDLDCDSIASTATIEAFTSEPIEKQDLLANYSEQSPELPRLAYIEAMGGLVCDWSNGVSTFSSSGGPGTPYIGTSIMILPEAGTQFAKFETMYGPASGVQCSASGPTCSLDTLVNGYWLSVEMHGVIFDDPTSDLPPALVSEFFDSVDSLISALGAPAPRWSPPEGTIALGADCELIIPTSDVQSALALTNEPSVYKPGGGWSMWAGATVESGGGRCSWSANDEETYDGGLSWLPGGAWAAEKLLPGTTNPSGVTPVAIPDLATSDKAFLRCADDDSHCVVDLVIGGNWVQVDGYASSGELHVAHDRAIDLASVITARING
jgi:hypothetical protein